MIDQIPTAAVTTPFTTTAAATATAPQTPTTQSSRPTSSTSGRPATPAPSSTSTDSATLGASESPPPTQPKDSTTQGTESTSGGLSTGAKAGIAVGGVVGAVILAGALYFILRRRRKRAFHQAVLRPTSPELGEAAAVRGHELDPETAKGGGGGLAITELHPKTEKVGGATIVEPHPQAAKVSGQTSATELANDVTVMPPELSATKCHDAADRKPELPETSTPAAERSVPLPGVAQWSIAGDSGRTGATSSPGSSPPYIVELSTDRPKPIPSELYTTSPAQVPSELYASGLSQAPLELYNPPSQALPSDPYASNTIQAPPSPVVAGPGTGPEPSNIIPPAPEQSSWTTGEEYGLPPPLATTPENRLAEAELEQLLRQEEELERRRRTLVELRSVEDQQAALKERIKVARAQIP